MGRPKRDLDAKLFVKAQLRMSIFVSVVAEQHPSTKTLEPSDTFCRLFTLAFATGSFPDGQRKPSLMGIDGLMCRACKI
jgi:hypothetical protein